MTNLPTPPETHRKAIKIIVVIGAVDDWPSMTHRDRFDKEVHLAAVAEQLRRELVNRLGPGERIERIAFPTG